MGRKFVKKMIIIECHKQGIWHKDMIRYILATVEHETAGTFMPVEEAFWVKAKFMHKYGKKKGRRKWYKWARRNFKTKRGKVYFPYHGRGLVQLTWLKNYKKFKKIIKQELNREIDIVTYPYKVMELELSIFILVYGMKHGLFTGKRLLDYFGQTGSNFRGARRIINGTDKAKRIARMAEAIEFKDVV